MCLASRQLFTGKGGRGLLALMVIIVFLHAAEVLSPRVQKAGGLKWVRLKLYLWGTERDAAWAL